MKPALNPGGMPIDDRGKIITHDLIPGHEYEVIVRAIGPDGTMEPMEHAARNTIVIQGKQASPTAIITFTASAFIEAVTLSWTNSLDFDIDHVEIWRSATNNISTAAKIAEVRGITYTDSIGEANVTRYYWIRAVNTSGQSSTYYPDTTAGVSATTIGIVATDIDDFAITATKRFDKTIILTGDAWTNNSPAGGRIAWNAHTIVWNGATYAISAGNTDFAYLYWAVGNATYSPAGTHPVLGTNAFMIAINTGGTHTLVWNSSANMVIGTAFIANLAVTNAKIANATITDAQIASLNVDKVNAGTLTGRTVQTASSGQRVVMSGPSNKISLFVGAGAGTEVVTIDDNIDGLGVPGILCSDTGSGIFVSKNTSNGSTGRFGATQLFMHSHTAVSPLVIEYADSAILTFDQTGDLNITGSYSVDGTQVVSNQGAAVANATAVLGVVTAQLNALLARCRAHGLIAP